MYIYMYILYLKYLYTWSKYRFVFLKIIQANADGDLPIHLAATSGHTEAVEELLHAGMDIDALNTITEHTPLELAVCYEQVHMVEFLLNRKAKLEIPS